MEFGLVHIVWITPATLTANVLIEHKLRFLFHLLRRRSSRSPARGPEKRSKKLCCHSSILDRPHSAAACIIIDGLAVKPFKGLQIPKDSSLRLLWRWPVSTRNTQEFSKSPVLATRGERKTKAQVIASLNRNSLLNIRRLLNPLTFLQPRRKTNLSLMRFVKGHTFFLGHFLKWDSLWQT